MFLNFKIIIAFLLLNHASTKLPRRYRHRRYKNFPKKPNIRVLNGIDAPISDFPYIVRMEFHLTFVVPDQNFDLLKPLHVCTCAQVAPEWSLTAAHCAEGLLDRLKIIENKDNVRARGLIRYGAVNDVLNHTSDIIKLISHPSYVKEPVLMNDIALAKTNRIIMKNYGKISAVDYKTLIGLKAKIVGFGDMNMTIDNKQIIQHTFFFQKPLQVMNVVINTCEEILKKRINPAICLAPPCQIQTAVCPGDSGGPLLQGNKIVGVNSLGPVVDCQGRPKEEPYSFLVGLITPVSPFLDWIAYHIDLVPNY